MDVLYRALFWTRIDTAPTREDAIGLQRTAQTAAGPVNVDQPLLGAFGQALIALSNSLDKSTAIDASRLRQACITASDPSAFAGERLVALERIVSSAAATIDGLRERLDRAEKEATIDALTGLVNRRMFDDSLVKTTAQSNADTSDLSLLMLDVDHFKHFNDAHGHAAGDNVLRLIGRLLQNHIDRRDVAARYGGEEFAVILPGAGLACAVRLAEQIRRALRQAPIINRLSGESLVVTCSIGVAQCYRHEPIDDWVDRADQALYQAKCDGRDMVRGHGKPGQ
jgi:diguanylate cyclase